MQNHADGAARINNVPRRGRFAEYPGARPVLPENFATSPAAWTRLAASAAEVSSTLGTVLFAGLPTCIMC